MNTQRAVRIPIFGLGCGGGGSTTIERELARHQADDSDVMRSIMALEADHRQALIRAEETGYGRGVRDMTPACEKCKLPIGVSPGYAASARNPEPPRADSDGRRPPVKRG